MDAATALAQLPLIDQTQWRYEVIRPLVLCADRTAPQRAQETATHPETGRMLHRRFRQQGMLGLLPGDVEVVRRGRATTVPDDVRAEIDRLKALASGFHSRELARLVFCKCAYPIDDKTVKCLWHQSPVPTQQQWEFWTYPTYPDRYQARLQVIKLYYQGWDKLSISRFGQGSRPTVETWITRFEAEHWAGLMDKKRGPQAPPRKVWLPRMVQVDHLQKAHPDAGAFRLWSLLAQPAISVRTVGRIMALHKLVYDAIPHVTTPAPPSVPPPHPYTAQHRHEYWFIEGRQMDCALDGGKWWSILILEGSSRPIRAGAMAPTEATWAALMVLYTAWGWYGAPTYLVSDRGGAYTSDAFAAVCTRLEIDHKTIVSTPGQSSLHWIETPFDIQRRLYDYQFSLARPPSDFEQRHQEFRQLYNTTAHQGLLADQRLAPIPVEILGAAQGRRSPQEVLVEKVAPALLPRTTKHYGCVTWPSYHLYVASGVPQTQVLLWVYGEQLRAVLDPGVWAEYHGHYDGRMRQVTDSRDGIFSPTRLASPQGTLIPLTPQETLVLYRPPAPRRQTRKPLATQQLVLFELVRTG